MNFDRLYELIQEDLRAQPSGQGIPQSEILKHGAPPQQQAPNQPPNQQQQQQAKPIIKKSASGMQYEQVDRNDANLRKAIQQGLTRFKWVVSSQFKPQGQMFMTAAFYDEKDAHNHLRQLVRVNTANNLQSKVYYAP
jgi:hypothetical protein